MQADIPTMGTKKHPDRHDKGEELPKTGLDRQQHGDGVSLKGPQGQEVARNLLKLSAGMVKPEDLGENYYLTKSGALGLRVDEDTMEAFLQ